MGAFDKLMGKGGGDDSPKEKSGGGLLGGLMGKKGDGGGGGNPLSKMKLGGGKKGDGCASIFEESVPDVVIEDFRQSGLETTHDGHRVYLGLLLDTNDIGGFGRKSRKDEQKGSIIECINKGRIKVLATPELLERELLVFIPQPDTIDAMADFALLTNATYAMVYVDDDCGVEDTEHDVTWEIMRNVVEEHIDADTLLNSIGVTEGHGGGTAPIPSVDPNPGMNDFDQAAATSDFLAGVREEFETDDPQPVDTGVPSLNIVGDETAPIEDANVGGYNSFIAAADNMEVSLDDDTTAMSPITSDTVSEPQLSFVEEAVIDTEKAKEDNILASHEVKETVINPEDIITIQDSIDPNDIAESIEDYDEDGVVEEEVDSDVFSEAMVRHFYSDDLRLEVSTEAFDAQFMHLNAYVPFPTDRPAGWMNDYLNQYCRDANAELKRFHNANLLRVREKFFNLLSMHAEAIQRELDINDPSTFYGKQKVNLTLRKQEQMDEADGIIREKREAIEEAYETRVHDAGIAAAQAAEQQYRDRYGRSHEEEMRNAEAMVRDGIENEYQDALREINDERRAHASRRMDYGITETLHACSTEYMELLEGEQAVYKRYRDGINRFIDENRKDDIARSEALAEELRQSEKADAIMTEYSNKLNAMSAEYEAKRRELMAKLDSQAAEYQEAIERLNSTHEAETSQLRSRNAMLEQKLDEYRDGMASMDAQKERTYKERIATIENERDAWRAEVEQTRGLNRNRSFVTIGLALVAAIAAGAIGMYIGTTTNVEKVSDDATSAIIEEYNQKLAQLQSQQSADVERALRDSEAQAQADARSSLSQNNSSSSSSANAQSQSSSSSAQNGSSSTPSEDRTR